MDKSGFKTIDEYISICPGEVQGRLKKIRQTIREAAPGAEEVISYQMPTFRLNGNLVHFAAFKNHIGFFPTPSGVKAFGHRLSNYKTSKGTIQFPMEEPIPYDLISDIVRFRVDENRKKEASNNMP